MKVQELLSVTEDAVADFHKKRFEDGKRAERLKKIDFNISMLSKMSNLPGVKKQIDSLKVSRQAIEDFYDGKIGYREVPYEAWELTNGIPDWGTKGT